jgi:hypothetical protein
MSTRFRVDLLRSGADLRETGWLAQTLGDWFTGPSGVRRLTLFTLGCVGLLVLILVALILPAYWRLSTDLNAVPGLRRDVAARQADLDLLRSNLGALSAEARRQIRWADLLAALSQEIPAGLKLQVVDGGRVAPPGAPGQQPGAPARFENTLRIDAITPVRSGSAPLLDVAQFMAGLMRNPAVSQRFQLKSWDLKPAGQNLDVSVVLAERAQ